MTVTTERAVPARRVEQVIVNFDAEAVSAPFILRCGALLIDYMIVVAAPVLVLLFGRMGGADGGKLLAGPMYSTGWLIGVLLGVTNLLILPAIIGQSVGKALTGIRIVNMNGGAVNFSHILLRNILGYFLTVLTGFLGFIWAAINPNGRALHDYVGGTVVIYGQKRPKKS